MARQSIRVAMAGLAAAAVLLTACGKPPTTVEPMAAPAPQATTQAPQPEPVAPPPSEPEPTEEAASPQPAPTTQSAPTTKPAQTTKPTSTTKATPKAASTTKAIPKATKATSTTKATPKATSTTKSAETTEPTSKPAQPAGPAILKQGDQSDRVKELQARLKQIGWFSGVTTGYYGATTKTSVAGFQAKRGLTANGAVDQKTWDGLVGMTRKPTADELADKPAAPASTTAAEGPRKAQGLDPRCMTGRVICISKRSNKLWWVKDGVVQMTMDARFGTTEYRTREGTFSVEWKSRDHVSNIYHTSMPFALFFSGGQAVHYSPDFAARGYNGGSHGCVNLRDRGGAQTLFNQTRVGDKVVVYS